MCKSRARTYRFSTNSTVSIELTSPPRICQPASSSEWLRYFVAAILSYKPSPSAASRGAFFLHRLSQGRDSSAVRRLPFGPIVDVLELVFDRFAVFCCTVHL